MGFHGKRWTDAMRAKRSPPVAERFDGRFEFDTNGGCWLWTGALVKSTGYGTIQANGKTTGAHRMAYMLRHGEIPNGLHVCHRCDVRCCVNPAHLFLGTHAENMADMARKGRRNPLRGEARAGSKLTAADIPVVLARLNRGEACLAIARDYGLTDCAINAIRRGKSWTHVTGLSSTRGTTLHDGDRAAAGDNLAADVAA